MVKCGGWLIAVKRRIVMPQETFDVANEEWQKRLVGIVGRSGESRIAIIRGALYQKVLSLAKVEEPAASAIRVKFRLLDGHDADDMRVLQDFVATGRQGKRGEFVIRAEMRWFLVEPKKPDTPRVREMVKENFLLTAEEGCVDFPFCCCSCDRLVECKRWDCKAWVCAAKCSREARIVVCEDCYAKPDAIKRAKEGPRLRFEV